MSVREEKARNMKSSGNNCSVSVYTVFMDELNLSGDIPEPKSIDGKCGALLAALQILDETGHGDKKEEFEKKFIELFGYDKCYDLMTHEARCNDYVGICVRMLEEIINDK